MFTREIRPKNRRKHNHHFRTVFFFIIILHFFTSNQLSTDRKLNLPLTSSVYFVFFALEMQKRLKQSKIYHKFSHFVWKETTHKPLKVPAPRTLFFSVYVIATTCFDQCFLFCVIPERHCFSWKFIVTPRLFQATCWCFLWSQCIARSPYFMLYLRNNNTMLIPKFQNKADCAS